MLVQTFSASSTLSFIDAQEKALEKLTPFLEENSAKSVQLVIDKSTTMPETYFAFYNVVYSGS